MISDILYIRFLDKIMFLCPFQKTFTEALIKKATIWRRIVHWIKKFNTWKFQAKTRGEHVVCRNCFWYSEKILYTACSPHVLQKEELLTNIYLYVQRTLLKNSNSHVESLFCSSRIWKYNSDFGKTAALFLLILHSIHFFKSHF